MRTIFLLIIFNLILTNARGQKTIEIPEFKNINPDDKYPERSILASYTNIFDILISLNCYSAWGPDYNIKAFAHHKSGWYKIEINTDEKTFDPYTVCLSTYKINDSIGDILWDSLNQNHIFVMNDGRVISFICAEKMDTILTKEGKVIEVLEPFDLGCDMPEYEFEMITKDNYKKLYFYSPQEFLNRCKTFSEPKWFVNCINVFEKHLGK
jgi:hypothetical protein